MMCSIGCTCGRHTPRTVLPCPDGCTCHKHRNGSKPCLPGCQCGHHTVGPQSAEHIEKRKRFGPAHHAWKGDNVSAATARCRTKRAFPDAESCTQCGAEPAERHHRDGNPTNNASDNVAILCRRCHMELDGRLAAFRNHPAAVEQRNHVNDRWRS
jgi:hypothetical protein